MKITAVIFVFLGLVPTCSLAVDSNNIFVQKLLDGMLHTTEWPRSAVRPVSRIIGGSRVYNRCQPPFDAMVALQLNSNQPLAKTTHCSGVLISSDLVVTAASCVYPFMNAPQPVITAILGEKQFDFLDNGQQNIPVTNFKIHPGYNSTTRDNNIALIKLDTNVQMNACINTLSRYTRSDSACSPGKMECLITGWGRFDLFGSQTINSKNPLYGPVNIYDEEVSKLLAGSRGYPNTVYREGSLLGMAPKGSAVQACELDWGGMAACKVEGSWKLRGIITEVNCAFSDNPEPMTFANMDKFRSWIDACQSNFATCRGM